MIYEVMHVTRYTYASAVPFARCCVHLLPATRGGQTVRAARLEVSPAPLAQADHIDFFGNVATHLDVETPHRELTLTASAEIAVDRGEFALPADSPRWEAVAEEALSKRSMAPVSPVHFLFASRQIPLFRDITAYAAESFTAVRPVLEAALELTVRMRGDFAYDPTTTDVATPIEVAFAARSGVCQDFAHLMIAGLRGLGVPAAYVSGYLRTQPPAGSPRLQGADATHAWVSVWCGEETGWIGVDPTNGMPAGDSHIELAIGRDYADVAPVSGIIVASGAHTLSVAVDVRPVDHEAVATALPRQASAA